MRAGPNVISFFVAALALALMLWVVPTRQLFDTAEDFDWLATVTSEEQSPGSRFNVDRRSISERPLFDASRRPPADVRVPDPVPVEPMAAPIRLPVLLGTMKAGSDEMAAYISLAEGDEAVRVRVGDFIGSWEVESISDGAVGLERDGESYQVVLQEE